MVPPMMIRGRDNLNLNGLRNGSRAGRSGQRAEPAVARLDLLCNEFESVELRLEMAQAIMMMIMMVRLTPGQTQYWRKSSNTTRAWA